MREGGARQGSLMGEGGRAHQEALGKVHDGAGVEAAEARGKSAHEVVEDDGDVCAEVLVDLGDACTVPVLDEIAQHQRHELVELPHKHVLILLQQTARA